LAVAPVTLLIYIPFIKRILQHLEATRNYRFFQICLSFQLTF